MRYAILSDIHSNLEALSAVLAEIEAESIDRVICLGDVVGYGANPNECLQLVQEFCDITLLGNHDSACLNKTEMLFFNRFAKQAIEWTLSVIKKENLTFLSQLKLNHCENDIQFVHANPYTPDTWDYLLSIDDAIFNFSRFDQRFCFIGHSHQPIIFSESKDQQYTNLEDEEINIENEARYIINVGSVGQPRDKNPAAAFGILDTKNKSYEVIRVAYNIERTRDQMLKAGLPTFLGDRLASGR